MREDVQQHFGVRVGTQVPAILAHQQVRKLVVIGQVAVVRKADAVGRIDIEGLRLGRLRPTRRRVAHVADAHVAGKAQHMAGAEHVPYQPVGFALFQSLLAPGDNACRILATVLHHRQAVIQRLVDRVPANDSDNAAHASLPVHLPPGNLSCSGSSIGSESAGSSGVSSS